MTREDIFKTVDHTLLAQTATWEEIKEICDDAIKYQTASVCIPASYVKRAKDYVDGICDITGNEGIRTICAAEPIGPNNFQDIMVIAPCTGNTAAKLCNGITDTPVLMAAKAHMRNGKPLVISISTNDALGANFKNIGMLMNTKNVYFGPFGQDNCKSKPNSLVAKMELLPETIEYALNGKQIQPVIQNPD